LKTAKPEKHTFVVQGTSFTVNPRYEYIKQIGHGAYGVVCSAIDKKASSKVAIKKVSIMNLL
jgi:mitogen-activated protein kinase 1/3